jgi:glycosyltransferase involved in cell wall biosynthesis
VLAYGKGGCLETVIDGKTGLFFPEQTVASIKQTIQEFIVREGDFNPETISQHAQQFSRQRFQTEIKQLVDKHWSTHSLRHSGDSAVQQKTPESYKQY